MIKIYYSIWDYVLNLQRQQVIRNYSGVFIGMSVLLSTNIATIYLIIKFLTNLDIFMILNSCSPFPNGQLKTLWFFIYFFAPALIINYFLVVYKKKYKIIMRKYRNYRKGTIPIIYAVATVVLFMGTYFLK